MSLRELATVALRLAALWLIISTIAFLPAVAYSVVRYSQMGATSSSAMAAVLTSLCAAGGRFVLGVILFALSSRIADFVCRGIGEESGRIEVIRPGHLYHIATFLMGVFVVTQSLGPAARSLVAYASQTAGIQNAAELVQFLLALGFGAGLMLGSRGLARFFANLGYDPDNVPAQQFSVRTILLIVIAIAILLGIVHRLTA
jgi:hypothetical protein